MLLPQPSDAIHKAWLYRVLSSIGETAFLVEALRFKGGTCAAMQDFIERFSVDLDFDLIDVDKLAEVRVELKKIFKKLGMEIKEESQKTAQFFLKYDARENSRNTLRFDVTFPTPDANIYEPVRFTDIDRIIYCQTIETMFANKLVAVLDRYEKQGSIAGRDIFDIHTFLLKGISFNEEVIIERRATTVKIFFQNLIDFIDQKISQQILDEDLNHLLLPEQFKKVRKFLKQEVLMLLRQKA